MKNLLPFFTRLPVRGDFEKAQGELWALPLVALLSSALPTAVLYLNFPLGNVLAVLALYFTIGLLHLDGLADWADGMMVKGDRGRKVKAMKDVNIGIAGVFAVVMVLLLQVYSLSLVPAYALFLAELNSKFSMLLALATRKPLGDGLGAYFMGGINKGQLVIGAILYVLLLLPMVFIEPRSLASLLGLLAGAYVISLSLRNFGGLNGDCIGAIAEITRAGTLLTLALVR
ncbi:adenosylcobinamide-GDP ribazoletransferase [Thermococcus sp. 5-4]|uniref:adenosylcobinamide-GDP ribazoletransferase n=1 Tax=Thermococcus sp. 5-4 TaxID=2008440 RepID=UPI000B4998C7|nr:adenosylcobinamide-GDP ribazoletransferase [Thermococcus sp. 5-4]ASA77507.1 adenosylcobinamide-GDP ribazoletransferase [Thermococcus sp. 5-4]